MYELKHDGYRLLIRKTGVDIRIYSRRGADFTKRFPRLVEAARRLRATSAVLDGQGIVYDQHGMPDFDLIHSKEYDREVSLVAFDLLELDSEDLRPLALAKRKQRPNRCVTVLNIRSTLTGMAPISSEQLARWDTKASTARAMSHDQEPPFQPCTVAAKKACLRFTGRPRHKVIV